MESTSGTLILGRFRVVGGRGRPGGAEVYDAIDEQSGQSARLVVLDDVPAGEDPERVLERAFRYAIGCAGIARLLAAGVGGAGEGASARTQRIVVAYDAPGGRTLDDLIRSRAEPTEIARVMSLVARALSPLHDQGVAHAYLRPGLVTLTEDGVSLQGFGVAKLAQSLGGPALARDALPTVYRAPELRGAMPARAETWADVYALGVLATELIAGRQVPARLDEPTPRGLGLEVGDALESCVAEAVAASVGARPHDVEMWALRLEAALGEPGAFAYAGRAADVVEAAQSAGQPDLAVRDSAAQPAGQGASEPEPAPSASPAEPRPAPSVAASSASEPEPAPSTPGATAAESTPSEPETAQARPSAPAQAGPTAEPQVPATAGREPDEALPHEPGAAALDGDAELVPPVAPSPDATRGPERSAPASRAAPSTWPIVLAVGGALLLMVAGVGAAFWFALARRAPKATARSVATAAVPPTLTAPRSGMSVPPAPATSPATPDGGVASSTLPEPAPLPSGHGVHRGSSAGVPLPVEPDDPVWGKPDAPVTLMVFGDLDCPYTRRSFDVLERLETRFGGDLRLVWKNRPLDVHPHARDAATVAVALEATRGDGAFWKFASLVAAASQRSTTAHLSHWVSDAGGDGGRVPAWLANPRYSKRVDRALELAGRYNIRSTPTFFVNGLRIEGYQPFGALERVVARELSRARALARMGVAARDVYADRVRKNLIDLGPAVPDRTCPPVAGSPVRGPDDALVTIVEYSDFQCPFCKRAESTLRELRAHYGGDIRVVWKNFPLPFHHDARPAANFAMEAMARGGNATFWQVHDALFAAQPSFDDANLGRIARDAGLDPVPLLRAAHDGSHRSDIDGDVREGKGFGVTGTPTFFINGRELDGAQPLSKFESLINAELSSAKRLLASGTPRRRVYTAVCSTP